MTTITQLPIITELTPGAVTVIAQRPAPGAEEQSFQYEIGSLSQQLTEAVATTTADAVQTSADRVQTMADAAQTSGDAIQTAADSAQTQADAAQTSADAIQTAADRVQADSDAARAETAAANAMLNGNLFADTTTGLAHTSGTGDTNRFFAVPDTDENYGRLYRNDAGSATYINTYPSKQALDAAIADLEASIAQSNASYAALAGYVDPDTTYGTAPATGTANPYDALSSNKVLIGNTVDKKLQQILAFVMTVGNGTGFLDLIQVNSDGTGTRINRANITGIGSTGAVTLDAGTDFEDGLVVPPNCYAYLGSGSGGTKFATTADVGNGLNITTTDSGVAIVLDVGNVIGKHQVVLADPMAVETDVDQVRVLASQGSLAVEDQGYILAPQDVSSLNFSMVGDQGLSVPLSTAQPVLQKGPLAEIEYIGVAAGTALWEVRRGASPDAVYVGGGSFSALDTSGARTTYAIPDDEQVDCEVGDYIFFIGRGGRVATQSWSNQPGVYPQTDADYSGATYTTLSRRAAFRGILRVPKSTIAVAQAASRQWARVVNQEFPGSSLPAGWTGNSGTFTCSNALVSPGSGGWATYFAINLNTSANVRKGSVTLTMTTATSVGGLCWVPQALTGGLGGMIIHVDASAGAGSAVLKAYAWDGSSAGTGAKSVSIPWTIGAASKIMLAWSLELGTMVITATNPVTGAVATLNVQFGDALFSGVPFGRLGAHFYSGSMKWNSLQSWTPKTDIIVMGDSIGQGVKHGDLLQYSWVNRVVSSRGKADMLNCSLSAANPDSALACLPMELLANPNAQVVWSVGVNPSNAQGTSDAQRYAQYIVSTAAAYALATGGFSITTPTPYTNLSTYVQMVRDGVIAGSIVGGPCAYANMTDTISVSNLGAAMLTALTYDTLHPVLAGDAILAPLAQAQLPVLAA